MTIEILERPAPVPLAPRRVQDAMLRGAALRCPACGQGAMFHKYLKVADACPACGEELHHQRADDAPPYFTMLVVGHIVVAGVMYVEKAYAPDLWVHAALWTPLILGLSLALLPRVKGALIGLQWALRMHGFGGGTETVEEIPEAHRPARR